MPYRLRLRSRSQAEANTAPALAVNSMPVNVETVEAIGLSFLRWHRGSGNVRPPWKHNANQTGAGRGACPYRCGEWRRQCYNSDDRNYECTDGAGGRDAEGW